MLTYPHIDPIALQIGPVAIHWYGLMYVVGLLFAWYLGNLRARKPGSVLNSNQVADVIFYGAVGVVIGGRLGYMLFYNTAAFLAHPLDIFKIWQGGMSFHGGLVGVIAALCLYAYKTKIPFFAITDFAAPLVPIGLGAGRIGNFINGELWGRVTDVPWGMVFPFAGPEPRHPSQLYEFFLEGVVFFIILWWFSSKPRPRMAVSGLFLICYGVFRFIVEFFRSPDPQLSFIWGGWMTMGQLLSIPMILLGLFLFWQAYRKHNNNPNKVPQHAPIP